MKEKPLYLLMGLLAFPILAQKGMPPRKQIQVWHSTQYPQHVVFSSELLDRLKEEKNSVPLKEFKIKEAVFTAL